MTLSVKEKKHRERLVLKYRKENLYIREIVEKSKLSMGIVGRIVKEMGDDGKISGRSDIAIRDFNSPKVQTIITMRNDGKTLAEIGKRYGFTRERARQLIVCIKSRHGDVIQPNFMMAEEAGERLGRSGTTIRMWLMKVKCKRQGRKCIIDDEWLSKLEEYRDNQIITRRCVVCKAKMENLPKSSTKKYCSDECWAKDRNPNNLFGWRKEAWLILKNRKKKYDNGEWLGLMVAAKRANISEMQLLWLAVYGVLSMKDNPKVKNRSGKPAKMYSVIEMDLIRKISPNRKKRK